MGTTSTLFQNGQTLTSSALTLRLINFIFQETIAVLLGILVEYEIQATLVQGSNEATVISTTGLAAGFVIQDQTGNIPSGTTILGISGPTTIIMSNLATADAQETVIISDLVRLNTMVRNSWQTQGAPAWGVTDDIVSFQCTEEDNEYNKVRDALNVANDDVSLLRTMEYTRVWRVALVVRGPNSLDNVRLIKSSIQLDFIHAILAEFNLYLMPSVGNGVRVPELQDGQWWERVDISFQFYEQVNETIVIPSVASVPITTSNQNGVQSDIVVTA
jgi:hypothetical protein